MKKRILALLLAAVFIFALAACASPAPAETTSKESDAATKTDTTTDTKNEASEEIRIGVLLKPESNEYWSSMKTAIEDWAKEQDGVTVDVLCAESEENISGQLEQLENMISKDYDAICAAPLSSSNLVQGVLKAAAAGIPVVNIDESIDENAVIEGGGNMVGRYSTDNIVVGQKGAKYIAEQIGNGKAAIIEGTSGNAVSINRTKGAADYFAENGVELAASQSGDWDRMISMDVATNIMQANPDLKAFYCVNDNMALGVYEAVLNAGKKDDIIVVGTDAVNNAKVSIKNGEMAASVGQDNTGIGIACCELAVKAVKENWVADPAAEMPVYFIDSFLVTKDNVDDYLN